MGVTGIRQSANHRKLPDSELAEYLRLPEYRERGGKGVKKYRTMCAVETGKEKAAPIPTIWYELIPTNFPWVEYRLQKAACHFPSIPLARGGNLLGCPHMSGKRLRAGLPGRGLVEKRG